MKIELCRNEKKLKEDIEVLKKAIKVVISSPEFRNLFGKTQFLDADEITGLNQHDNNTHQEWTDRRTRGDHSISVAAIAAKFIEKVYIDSFDFERINEKGKLPDAEEQGILGNFPKVEVKEGTDIKSNEYKLYQLNKQRAMLLALLSGYAHDLGHTPFGHDGEEAISKIYKNYQKKQSNEERRKALDERREIFGDIYEENLGHTVDFSGVSSFEHIEQSYINFLNVINRKKVVFPDDLLETCKFAILAHSRSRVKSLPTHINSNDLLVIHAIRTADKGDYQIVDGAEIERLIDFQHPRSEYLDKSMYEKINQFIDEWSRDVEETDELSDDMYSIYKLKQYRKIYDMWAILYCEINQEDINKIGNELSLREMQADPEKIPIGTVGIFKGNKARNRCIVEKLMEYYLANYDEIPNKRYQDDTKEAGHIKREGRRYESFDKSFWEQIGYSKEVIVIGFITSLTNQEAKVLYEGLVNFRIEQGEGHGIEPIKKEEIDQVNRQYTLDYLKQMHNRLMADQLSDDEKRKLEQKLKRVLLANKEFLNSSLTDNGYITIGKARSYRIKAYAEDNEMYERMKKEDAKRNSKGSGLKYPNTSGDEENSGGRE